jgi:hypothetical protein
LQYKAAQLSQSASSAQPSMNHAPRSTISFATRAAPAQREEIRQQALQSNYGVAKNIGLPCPNVSFLSPHLQEYRYFAVRGERKKLDEALRPRLMAAKCEVEILLAPAGEDVAKELTQRIFCRCPAVKPESKATLMEDYQHSLSTYPLDMLYCAVDKVMHAHIAAYPPLLSSFFSYMDTELKQRHYVCNQVMKLCALLA